MTTIEAFPGVGAAVSAVRDAMDALRHHRVLRAAAEQVSAESMLRGARASAALQGSHLPLDLLRRRMRSLEHQAEPGDRIVDGALRATAEVGRLQQTWRRAPLQVLARLHALAAVGLVDDQELGRPRTGAAARLTGLAQLLTAPTPAPAVVVAAVAHGEILAHQVFPATSGVVARAAQRLVITGRGLDPTSVSVPEVGHVELGEDAYQAALAGYAEGGRDGVAGWVRHCADAMVLGAREGVAICESLQRA